MGIQVDLPLCFSVRSSRAVFSWGPACMTIAESMSQQYRHGTGYLTCGLQGKMKMQGPLFTITKDLKIVTAEHELKHGCP